MMRNPLVSIAKGIAIILMVMAHARCGIWWQNYINMFHMPLFLFMSGYCFREAHFDDAKGFVKKRIKGVWWPFVKWQLVFLLLHNVFFALNIYNGEYGFGGAVSHEYGLMETLKNALFIVTTMSHGEQLLGGFWFLKSLFVGSMFFFFLTKIGLYIERKKTIVDISTGLMLFIATLILGFIGKDIPFVGIGAKDIMAGLFIWSGYMYNKHNFSIEKQWWLIGVFALIVAVGTELWQCSMLHFKDNFKLMLPYIATALIGTLMVLCVSKLLSKQDNWLKHFLTFVGDNTLDILTWHFLSFKLVSLLLMFLFGLSIERLAEFPVIEEYAYQGWWVIYLVIGVVVPLGVSLVKEKFVNTKFNPK